MRMYTFILNFCPIPPGMNQQEEAEIKFLVMDGKDERRILKTLWETAEFRVWISENLSRILREPFPHFFGQGGSIAKGISSFYDSVNPEDDDLIDSAFDYRRAHGLRFGLRGARIQDIYVGQRYGNLEISSYSEKDKWSYFIYADSFENEMKKLLGNHSNSG